MLIWKKAMKNTFGEYGGKVVNMVDRSNEKHFELKKIAIHSCVKHYKKARV